MTDGGWNLLWERTGAPAEPERGEERERAPVPPAARETRRQPGAGPAPAWARRGGALQARFGNHAVQQMLAPPVATIATEEVEAMPAAPVVQPQVEPDVTAATVAEVPAPGAIVTPVPETPAPPSRTPAAMPVTADTGTEPVPVAMPMAEDMVPGPGPGEEASVETAIVEATASLETEKVRETPVAPPPLPAAVERAVVESSGPRWASALARFLGVLAAGPRLADWTVLAAAYAGATDKALDEAVGVVTELVLDLPGPRRRRVDAQVDALARVPEANELAARLRARLAAEASPQPEPEPEPPGPGSGGGPARGGGGRGQERGRHPRRAQGG